MTEKLLSIKDVAQWLDVSERTIFTLRKDGKLKAMKVGGQWRFDPESIREYLRSEQESKQHG